LEDSIENYYSFIETSIFTRQVTDIDENSIDLLTAIQNDLLEDPFRGDVVKGTNGARKARVADPKSNRGKRGGYRYLYLYLEHKGRIYLLFLYGKKDQSDLTPEQTEIVASLVKQIKGDNEDESQ
jgi:mRNA-degrading endonuclease RelE of RelBE toxin-antitoxin system